MKKTFLLLLLLLVVIASALILSSCGNNDNSMPTGKKSAKTDAILTGPSGEITTLPAVTGEPSVTTAPVTAKETTLTDAKTTAPVTTEPVTTETIVTTEPKVTEKITTEKPKTTAPEVSGDPIVVSYDAEAVNEGKTFTGLPALPNVKYVIKDPYNKAKLSTEEKHFSYGIAKDGEPHSITVRNQKRFDEMKRPVLAWDNKTPTEEKVLYLTFDCGVIKTDHTQEILDVLEEKGVNVTFFLTLPFIKYYPDYVVRIIEEGHNVGNHTINHSNSCGMSLEKLAKELLGVDNYLRVNFGYQCKYFRYPYGYYSEQTVALIDSFGYRQVFWSIAHVDYNDDDQPSYDTAMSQLTGRLHPGAVILLHTSSSTNAEILADYIDYAREHGYTFKTLDDYPWPSNSK
ncbi:MAG: polysaccharide deacetylase family protein [Clostridia bacterium]|nr:polysaccharide deacetylase family protein [Clostridia bacterium]